MYSCHILETLFVHYEVGVGICRTHSVLFCFFKLFQQMIQKVFVDCTYLLHLDNVSVHLHRMCLKLDEWSFFLVKYTKCDFSEKCVPLSVFWLLSLFTFTVCFHHHDVFKQGKNDNVNNGRQVFILFSIVLQLCRLVSYCRLVYN